MNSRPSVLVHNVIKMIDYRPKFSITTEPLEGQNLILINTYPGAEGYYINPLIDSYVQLRLIDLITLASRSVRIRAQHEKNELILFPEVSPEEAGFVRNFLECDLEEYSMPEIDYMFFGAIASLLWNKSNMNSLAIIKKTVTLDANLIIKELSPIIAGDSLAQIPINRPEMA